MSASAAAFALIAALIGAGFASGKEIERFFARFGAGGPPLALLCALTLYVLTRALLDVCRRFEAVSLPDLCARLGSRSLRAVCAAVMSALLCASAGAMFCAGGELFALTLPLHTAYALGFAATAVLGAAFALGSLRGLSLLGGALVPLMAVLLCLLYRLEPAPLLPLAPAPSPLRGLLLSLCYAPLNLVLAGGVVCETAAVLDRRAARRAARLFALGFSALLLLGVGVLRRHHAQIQAQALPFVVLCARLGKAGFYACALMLYLAVLSTLAALLRALYGLWGAYTPSAASDARQKKKIQRTGCAALTLACALCALLGFERLIGAAYPTLGLLCSLLLLVILVRAYSTCER